MTLFKAALKQSNKSLVLSDDLKKTLC